MIDLAELKRLADEAAKQRLEWEMAGRPWPIWNSSMFEMHCALSPAAVLGLLAELESLRIGSADLRKANKSLKGSCEAVGKEFKQAKRERNSAMRERDKLKAENEALRNNAERYRWLIQNASVILDKKTAYHAETGFIKFDTMPGRGEIESAIDAAMSKKAQP